MWRLYVTLLLASIPLINGREKRSIDLIAAHGLISQERLPHDTSPSGYHLFLQPFPNDGYFEGKVKINVTIQHKTHEIVLHAHPDLVILHCNITQLIPSDEELKQANLSDPLERDLGPVPVVIESAERVRNKPLYNIVLQSPIKSGALLEVYLQFTGKLFNDSSEGLFRSSYVDPTTKETKWFVSTHMRPNMARSVFPCYDEPAFKVPIIISVARHKKMIAVSNMPLESTLPHESLKDWYWDTFKKSPVMATFSIGIVISEFSNITFNVTADKDFRLTIWARPDFINAIQNISEKVIDAIKVLEEFWQTPYPLPKLDIFALPNYQSTRPADSWGVLLFKESELVSRCSWQIIHELVYQWLGALATPFWWSDAHINNALVRYVAAHTSLKMHECDTFYNWPMTMLYSNYYEFSKRYPYGKSTAIKQDSSSSKTELVFRMLNYTLGETTFVHGMQRFMMDRQYKTFFGDDVWLSLTEQARFDEKLPQPITINEIAASWITKDRLPVVSVTRNYEDNTANLSQKVYLRERPHDVPDQEKFLWWIPIILVTQNHLDFRNSTPITWMKRERDIQLKDLPGKDSFIIVNPEEIGPFPVNYDEKNWNMLADFLCSENRQKIPVYTRAKLLHDAWNLAYAGELNFATALNMTLFLQNEREYLVWDPVFTFIDHIGRHIDSTSAHKKFQTYVKLLLTPLYKELGNETQEEEAEGKSHLRSSSKVFLCQAGYKPCIDEAQAAFKVWMESADPDEGNPVANQYICPVFKWGTMEEWEFGLERVIKFPSTRIPSERTYLLKTLAGCPNDAQKIERLLNITILEKNGNFTDNDMYLIFSMLTGGANGYTNLFNFLRNHWDAIKVRFEEKPQLWNSLVTSATTVFKTQKGLDMVSELYVEKQSEFGTADFVVERALKNIKEETKWSNENLPVIETWLDNYMKVNGINDTQKTLNFNKDNNSTSVY
ncbi:aminopeptidase N [Diorhabda sublineata]|uniref:aminopeptidase N n=1 Tax=Diorhabda sublineata TaxID=1163346 RepID=UPI0024E0875E|nr:aminopeptidase N [Diorhabda sublineata]